jgi:phage gp36-like protein
VAYATVDDAIIRYGTSFVTVSCDREGNGALDTFAFDQALEDASDWIDSYLMGRYDLPLIEYPNYLLLVCVDVAIFFSSETAGTMTTLKEDRYKRAVDYMEAVKSGKRRLCKAGASVTGLNKSQAAQIVTRREARDDLRRGNRHFTTRQTRDVL